jgi:hypothetical protein
MLYQQITLIVTAALTFITAVYYGHTVYQLSKPSFQLPTPPPWTFDLIKQKVLQVCTLDNSNTQELSAEELRQKRHENPSDVIGSYNAEYKTHQYNQIYAIVSAIVSAACVVTLYLTNKSEVQTTYNHGDDEMSLDEDCRQGLIEAYQAACQRATILTDGSPEFTALINFCRKFIEKQCTRENKYEGVLQSAGMLHELQNMMSIPKKGQYRRNRKFLQDQLMSAISNYRKQDLAATLFDIAQKGFKTGMEDSIVKIIKSELAKRVLACQYPYSRALDKVVVNVLQPKWFLRIGHDNYQYGPFEGLFDYLKTATQESGTVKTIWSELMTKIQEGLVEPLLPIVKEIRYLQQNQPFLKYDAGTHNDLSSLTNRHANRNHNWRGDITAYQFAVDIDDFIGEFIYNSALQVRLNGYDTKDKIGEHTIEDLLNDASCMRIQTGDRTQNSSLSTDNIGAQNGHRDAIYSQ